MTNFEAIVKNNPQFVKEVLAHSIGRDTLKDVATGDRKHYGVYSAGADKREMDFLNKEYAKLVLDDIEKKYLSDVIRPFKHNVRNIRKSRCSGQYFIEINMVHAYDRVCLPNFSTKSGMYKGMELNKLYTLEELGLQARPPLRSRFGDYLTKNKSCESEAVREIGLRVFTSNAQCFNYTTGRGVLSRGKIAQILTNKLPLFW